jgi:predicted protein tyrosine phosphatase
MDEITDQLWISDIDTVRENPISSAVDIVVSTCQDEVHGAVDQPYEHFEMADGRQDENGGDHSYEFFEHTVDYVRDQVQAGRTMVVHCHLGISRSSAVCATTIAAERDISFDEALETVEDARPIVDPNEDLQSHGRSYLSAND